MSCILREKSVVNFYIVFDLYKDDSMLIITDFGLILMSILFTQTIPCLEKMHKLVVVIRKLSKRLQLALEKRRALNRLQYWETLVHRGHRLVETNLLQLVVM